MRASWFAKGLIIASCLTRVGYGAVTSQTTHGVGRDDLNGMMSSADLLQGLIATELPGDQGWHPVNTAPADRLPAFTDGAGPLSDLTGLLNDFPPPGMPAKLVQYDLSGPHDITGINIFSGNGGGPSGGIDGRIFSTTVVRYSTNNGGDYSLLGYFQSDPSGAVNKDDGFPGRLEFASTLVSIVDDSAATMIAGVTNLQFDFYAVSNTQGQMQDPFGDVTDPANPSIPENTNPFTGTIDGIRSAFESPLIWEIDVNGQAAAATNANFDGDADVDGKDFLIWQGGFGKTGNAGLADGDADDGQDVDGADLAVWRGQFGTTGLMVAIPEPATGGAASIGMFVAAWVRRRRSQRRASSRVA